MINNQHINNIRIYHAKHKSFHELKNKHFFVYLNYNKNEYRELLIELLVHTVKEVNYRDKFSYQEFVDLMSDYFILTELNHDTHFPDFMRHEIMDNLYDIYKREEFHDFQGEVLELLMVYLEKTNKNKVFHEPYFYYKRKRLFNNQFKGSNCLIDVVTKDNETNDLTLIECKVNLDNRIKRLNRSRDKFNRKLKLMDKLENELSNYTNDHHEKIKVKKILASIKVPSKKLPSNYINYKYINLLDHFLLKKKIS